jgi:hypothetical protein
MQSRDEFMAVPTEKVAGIPVKATFLVNSAWANRRRSLIPARSGQKLVLGIW